jgi:protein TonB
LRVAVVPKPPPPAPPAPEIPPAPAKIVPRKRLARAPETPPSAAPPPPPLEAPPPPPHPEAPGDNRPAVLIAGVSLSATSRAGTLGVGVGNGPAGSQREGTPGQGEGHPWKAKEFAAPYALTEEPVFLDNVPPDQIRRYYPEAARREKIEAAVVVKMIVDGDGSVAKVTIVKDPGNGFREAALKVARLYRFKPARVNGRVVATEIQFTIHFELE